MNLEQIIAKEMAELTELLEDVKLRKKRIRKLQAAAELAKA